MPRRFVYLIEACIEKYGLAYMTKSGEQLCWQSVARNAMQFEDRTSAEDFADGVISTGSYQVIAMPLAWLH